MPKLIVDTADLYTAQEAAGHIGIGYATLYRWIKSGKIVPLRFQGHTLIPKSEVERLNKQRNGETPTPSPDK